MKRYVIVGTGIDVVDMARVEAAVARHGMRFVRRILAPQETAVYEQLARGRQLQYLAGRFAVKEAVAKAFGTGIGGAIGWQDIITAQVDGRPTVTLSAEAKRRWGQFPALIRTFGRAGATVTPVQNRPSLEGNPSDSSRLVDFTGRWCAADACDVPEPDIWSSLFVHVSLTHERHMAIAQAIVELTGE